MKIYLLLISLSLSFCKSDPTKKVQSAKKADSIELYLNAVETNVSAFNDISDSSIGTGLLTRRGLHAFKLVAVQTSSIATGDFDGDKKADTALFIAQKKNLKRGIVICFADRSKPPMIFAAGVNDNFGDDDYGYVGEFRTEKKGTEIYNQPGPDIISPEKLPTLAKSFFKRMRFTFMLWNPVEAAGFIGMTGHLKWLTQIKE